MTWNTPQGWIASRSRQLHGSQATAFIAKLHSPAPVPAIMVLWRGLLLLLALGLGLVGAQKTLEEVPVQLDFDAQKVEGRWLTMQLAASQAGLISPGDPLKLALHSIWTRGRNLEFILFWIGEGVCSKVNLTLQPTQIQGQYQGPARRMQEDPRWLKEYLGYVQKFQLQKAPVFNLDAHCPPPEA
ncbi:beta-lactoglobulin isoform X2 [Erinaceus europaeus]|uniref:Beta-lactoglobulin isoform X2 n=1 Tax=Erinaceus europaeus TaxID=9365 RepID=A0ABM3Y2S7_ERIEU|nr:beta-lactoglobulin isoform X2 [Erinaceus europaeus]